MHFTNGERILWNELADSRSKLRRKSWLLSNSLHFFSVAFFVSAFSVD